MAIARRRCRRLRARDVEVGAMALHLTNGLSLSTANLVSDLLTKPCGKEEYALFLMVCVAMNGG